MERWVCNGFSGDGRKSFESERVSNMKLSLLLQNGWPRAELQPAASSVRMRMIFVSQVLTYEATECTKSLWGWAKYGHELWLSYANLAAATSPRLD